MTRTLARVATALGLVLFLAACDKCGNWKLNIPGFGAATACTDVAPRG